MLLAQIFTKVGLPTHWHPCGLEKGLMPAVAQTRRKKELSVDNTICLSFSHDGVGTSSICWWPVPLTTISHALGFQLLYFGWCYRPYTTQSGSHLALFALYVPFLIHSNNFKMFLIYLIYPYQFLISWSSSDLRVFATSIMVVKLVSLDNSCSDTDM